MSKRVQRYVCDECLEAFYDREDANRCEQEHRERRDDEAKDKFRREIQEELYMLNIEQLAETLRLVKEMAGPPPGSTGT